MRARIIKLLRALLRRLHPRKTRRFAVKKRRGVNADVVRSANFLLDYRRAIDDDRLHTGERSWTTGEAIHPHAVIDLLKKGAHHDDG